MKIYFDDFNFAKIKKDDKLDKHYILYNNSKYYLTDLAYQNRTAEKCYLLASLDNSNNLVICQSESHKYIKKPN